MEDNKNDIVNNENPNPADNNGGENKETKMYSLEEVQKLIQSEADRRTNQALAKQKKQFDKEMSLSKLDDNEREKAEKDNTIAELKEQLAQMTIAQNRSDLKSVLSARGLSAEFADIVTITDDIEESQANIDKLDKLFKAAVKAEVEKRLATAGIPKGNGGNSGTITKESARNMSLAELQQLRTNNPELYYNLYK